MQDIYAKHLFKNVFLTYYEYVMDICVEFIWFIKLYVVIQLFYSKRSIAL